MSISLLKAGFLNKCTCQSKTKRARTEYRQIYEKMGRFLTQIVRFPLWEVVAAAVLAEYRAQ